MTVDHVHPLPREVAGSIRDELLNTVGAARLSEELKKTVLDALSGPTRILPEGKPNLCAALTTLSYVSASRRDASEVVPAAAAMEMLMAAGDLMDDLQDGEADLPKDRGSLGRVLETVVTLLTLCRVEVNGAVDRGIPARRVLRGGRVLDAITVDSLRGQALDMALEERADVSVGESLDVSRQKSGSLTRGAAELGASLGTDDLAQIELFAEFGRHFGLMMQLMNDIAAIWPGGPANTDLRLRKKTLPIAFALNVPERSSRYAREVRSYYYGPEDASSMSEEQIRSALWRCGATHYAWIVAAREKARAERIGRELAGGDLEGWPLARLLA